jgi:hypothetical protein
MTYEERVKEVYPNAAITYESGWNEWVLHSGAEMRTASSILATSYAKVPHFAEMWFVAWERIQSLLLKRLSE